MGTKIRQALQATDKKKGDFREWTGDLRLEKTLANDLQELTMPNLPARLGLNMNDGGYNPLVV